MKVLNFGSLNYDHVYEMDHFNRNSVYEIDTLLEKLPENYKNNHKMDRIVYAPSGQAYVGNTILLNESGNWQIVFELDGQKESYDFRVNKPIQF